MHPLRLAGSVSDGEVLVVLLFVAACHKTPEPVPGVAVAPVAPLPAPAPAVVEEVVPPAAPTSAGPLLTALSSRDDVACSDVEKLVPDPVPALVEVVGTVKMPPAAPMRAAGCLVDGHAHEVSDLIEGWMKGPDTKGLALLVAGKLDGLDPELAARFARAGMAGPWATDLEPKLEGSTLDEVRAVVGQ